MRTRDNKIFNNTKLFCVYFCIWIAENGILHIYAIVLSRGDPPRHHRPKIRCPFENFFYFFLHLYFYSMIYFFYFSYHTLILFCHLIIISDIIFSYSVWFCYKQKLSFYFLLYSYSYSYILLLLVYI